ncbi:MAG: phospholipid carrier-dependent glycosyltransferase [Altererythrobacter ishigakiensis]|nr:phospholipid carrier-dependent glycosyltransferase [Altererythrobacter ishigakiensis]
MSHAPEHDTDPILLTLTLGCVVGLFCAFRLTVQPDPLVTGTHYLPAALEILAGMVTLIASMRAIWHATRTRAVTLVSGLLLAAGLILMTQSRSLVPDIYLVCLLSLSAWQLSAAIRRPEQGRWRLAAVGVYFGLAMGVNWVAISLVFLAVAAFFVARLSAGRRRLMTSKRGIPVPGISLIEAIVWLGVVPLLIYAAATLAGISG